MPLNKQQYLRLLTTKSRGIIKIHGNSCSLQDVYVYLSVYTPFKQQVDFSFFLCRNYLSMGKYLQLQRILGLYTNVNSRHKKRNEGRSQ